MTPFTKRHPVLSFFICLVIALAGAAYSGFVAYGHRFPADATFYVVNLVAFITFIELVCDMVKNRPEVAGE